MGCLAVALYRKTLNLLILRISPLGTTSRSRMFANVRNLRKNNTIPLDLIATVLP